MDFLTFISVCVNRLMTLCPHWEEEVPADSESMTLVNRKLLNTLPGGRKPGSSAWPWISHEGPFNVEMTKSTHLFKLQMRKYQSAFKCIECQLKLLLVALPLRGMRLFCVLQRGGVWPSVQLALFMNYVHTDSRCEETIN